MRRRGSRSAGGIALSKNVCTPQSSNDDRQSTTRGPVFAKDGRRAAKASPAVTKSLRHLARDRDVAPAGQCRIGQRIVDVSAATGESQGRPEVIRDIEDDTNPPGCFHVGVLLVARANATRRRTCAAPMAPEVAVEQ